MTSTPDKAARSELTELINRYADIFDSRDLSGLADCFAPTGRLEIVRPEGNVVLVGPEKIAAYSDANFFTGPDALLGPDVTSTHLMGTVRITLDSDHARVRTAAVIFLSEASRLRIRGVDYTERCVLLDGRWLFEHRQHRLRWATSI